MLIQLNTACQLLTFHRQTRRPCRSSARSLYFSVFLAGLQSISDLQTNKNKQPALSAWTPNRIYVIDTRGVTFFFFFFTAQTNTK